MKKKKKGGCGSWEGRLTEEKFKEYHRKRTNIEQGVSGEEARSDLRRADVTTVCGTRTVGLGKRKSTPS